MDIPTFKSPTLEMTPSVVNLLKSLKKFHKEVDTIPKNADNPFFHSNYSPLETILPAIEKALENAGLELVQIPHGEGNLLMTTIVFDVETGEYMKGTLELTPVDKKPQSAGSAITYGRRYMIVAMLKLNTDKDDDGKMASGNKPKKSAPVETNPHVDEFMKDLEMSEKELIAWDEKLESAQDLKELKAFWATLPPLAQEKLADKKDELKAKLK